MATQVVEAEAMCPTQENDLCLIKVNIGVDM